MSKRYSGKSQKDRRASLEKKISRLKDYLRINFEKTNSQTKRTPNKLN